VTAGRFREDLWYRLNVFPITVPPLREHREDIPMLAQAFVERFCEKLSRPALALPTSVVQALQAYPWPGNVRELQNVLERAVLVSEGEALRLAEPLDAGLRTVGVVPPAFATLEASERAHILQVLEATGWRVEGRGGAADILGLKPSTLRSRMAKLDLAKDKPAS
jgi:transcriptional regulator with GAF, ATPase, and Fis domain